ncbi:unnamed protein product [Lathyrus sativus]|nr:unnamed protein product [Lathyrus sativus]
MASEGDSDATGWPYVVLDIDARVVKEGRKLGFPIIYGDGSSPGVLQSAGISSPKAIMIMLTEKKKLVEAVQRLRLAFPAVPIYARARDLKHLLDLKKAGATDATMENAETSLQLGSKLLKGLGMMSVDVAFLSQLVRDSMEQQAEVAVSLPDYRESNIMEPLQVRVADIKESRIPVATTTTPKYELSVQNQKDQASLSRIQKEVDPEEDEEDYELNQAVKFEENGASPTAKDVANLTNYAINKLANQHAVASAVAPAPVKNPQP